MKILVTMVGTQRREPVLWPDGWPVPREGDRFEVPGAPEVTTVRNVTWYPEGNNEEDDSEPFVYVVVGPRPFSYITSP